MDRKPPTPRGSLAACAYSPALLSGSGAIKMVAMLTNLRQKWPPLASASEGGACLLALDAAGRRCTLG